MLNRGETFYVLEVVRGRLPFPKLVEKIVDMCTRYRGALLIEDFPISKGLIQEAARDQPPHPLQEANYPDRQCDPAVRFYQPRPGR